VQLPANIRLRNVITVGFYYLLFTQLPHVSVLRPSSGRNMFTRNYSVDNGSVVLLY
jgi:hypothetical protein